jgi:hypothetical protein
MARYARLAPLLAAPAGLLTATHLLAQPGGQSTITVNWGAASPVPTLGTWGLLALAVLLAVVAFRLLQRQPAVLRGIALMAGAGAIFAAAIGGRDLVAGHPCLWWMPRRVLAAKPTRRLP